MDIDIAQLIADIKDVSSQILNKDVSTYRGFAERQLQAIAHQTSLVSKGVLTGEITEETRDFFLDGLEDMALSFAQTLRGLLQVTIEKIWNAVVGVLWKAIETATGLALPAP